MRGLLRICRFFLLRFYIPIFHVLVLSCLLWLVELEEMVVCYEGLVDGGFTGGRNVLDETFMDGICLYGQWY